MSNKRGDGTRKPSNKKSSPHNQVNWQRVVYRLTEGVLQDLPWTGDRSKLLGAIRGGDWETVLRVTKCDPPQLYADAACYFAAAQVEYLFKKLPIPGRDTECRKKAWDTFKADEWRNRRTNQRFTVLASRGGHTGRDLYDRLLARMRRFVVRVLGESPDLQRVYGYCDFGPGACVGAGGDSTHPYAKIDSLTVGRRALPYLLGAVWSHDQFRPLFTQEGPVQQMPRDKFREELTSHLGFVEHNKIDFVLKNALTHRLIASEPSGNQWLQSGIGGYMSAALKQYRPFINLRHQERNQLLAFEGSCESATRPMATIDLRSSSQSLATRMVESVFSLAPGWFRVMNDTRSHRYESTEGSGCYELFVSMGNGFCFPLQSLIYCAAIEAVYEECGRKPYYAVFGDDLIVDQDIALLLIEWLRFLGVRTNTDKTFVFGPFRESCGEDFFNGTPVRPYTLDFIPASPRDLLKVANGVRHQTPRPLTAAWYAIWDLMPREARQTVVPWRVPFDQGLYVDPEFYDLHKLDEFDNELQRYKVRLYRSDPIADRRWYGAKQHEAGQRFMALRGSTPETQNRVAYGREAPVSSDGGTPVPSYRRKVVERFLTL